MAHLTPTTHIVELKPFIDAEVFGVAEIHTAHTVVGAAHATGAKFLDYFAVAAATWAPINGHVCADFENLAKQVRSEMKGLDTAEAQMLFDNLAWPSASELRAHLLTSPLVHHDDADAETISIDYTKPLVLSGNLLYLTRQFVDEVNTAQAIGQRLNAPSIELPPRAEEWIAAVLGSEPNELQANAIRNVLRFPTSVLLGGPGTGKTYTIAGMVHALLEDHAQKSSMAPLRIALAAPTAKAAQQMTASITATLNAVDPKGNFTFPQQHRDALAEICGTSSTIHRLLGWAPNNRARFQHDHFSPLPYDVVVIDEVSMISLPLMARLLEALPATAKLVLVGDPAQLQSVEAGAVLPQIAHLASQQRYPITTLTKNWRQQESTNDGTTSPQLNEIGILAEKMRSAATATSSNEVTAIADDVASYLQSSLKDITFVELPSAKKESPASSHAPDPSTQHVRELIAPFLAAFTVAANCAKKGDADGALAALNTVRVLCAHREGKYGISHWNSVIADMVNVGHQRGSVGQPLLNTRNDVRSGLVNGDTSIVVQAGSSRRAAFPPRVSEDNAVSEQSEIRYFAPSALDDAQVAFAMTVHKAQGSQYDTVIVIVPPVGSPLLQRELLYTAATRARRHLVVVATTEAITTAISTSIQRASGLADHISRPRTIVSDSTSAP